MFQFAEYKELRGLSNSVSLTFILKYHWEIDGWGKENSSISIANTLDILQSSTKPSL